MNKNRFDDISAYIREHKRVALSELTEVFSISMPTLRRDLKKLQEMGVIHKVYGAVESCSERNLTPLSARIDINHKGKFRIARDAALRLCDGDVIFLDSGSTVGAMAPFLGRLQRLTVITNNILVIEKVIRLPKVELITLSGQYNRHTFSFVGDEVVPMLRRYNISKAFMGTTGLSVSSGITHAYIHEGAVKRSAVELAQETFLLADHLKFSTFAPYTYCSIADIDEIFTDEEPDPQYRAWCEDNHTKIAVAR